MDSVTAQIITENTQASMMLNGTLWVFMGFIGFLLAGSMIIKFAIKGA